MQSSLQSVWPIQLQSLESVETDLKLWPFASWMIRWTLSTHQPRQAAYLPGTRQLAPPAEGTPNQQRIRTCDHPHRLSLITDHLSLITVTYLISNLSVKYPPAEMSYSSQCSIRNLLQWWMFWTCAAWFHDVTQFTDSSHYWRPVRTRHLDQRRLLWRPMQTLLLPRHKRPHYAFHRSDERCCDRKIIHSGCVVEPTIAFVGLDPHCFLKQSPWTTADRFHRVQKDIRSNNLVVLFGIPFEGGRAYAVESAEAMQQNLVVCAGKPWESRTWERWND